MDLVERAKRILLQPGQEWQAINTEAVTTADLYRSYIVPLAAIGPVASIIGMSVVGVSVPFFGTYRVPFATALGHAVVSYVLTLVGVYVLALIINALAPTFAGREERHAGLEGGRLRQHGRVVGRCFQPDPHAECPRNPGPL